MDVLHCRRLVAHDKRAEPRTGYRVPYVIVYGTPGLPLIQLVKRYVSKCKSMFNEQEWMQSIN